MRNEHKYADWEMETQVMTLRTLAVYADNCFLFGFPMMHGNMAGSSSNNNQYVSTHEGYKIFLCVIHEKIKSLNLSRM